MPRIHVLLADASPVFLQAAANLLALDPDIATVSCARSAKEAVELVGRLRPELVLVDLGLPDISGLEVVGLIKEMPQAPRVLLMSMMSRPELHTSARWSGADGFISKPELETDLINYRGQFFGAADGAGKAQVLPAEPHHAPATDDEQGPPALID